MFNSAHQPTFWQTLVRRLWLRPLSFLLHLANRQGKDENFYKIKNKLLKRYSSHIGYDVQYIEGKDCFSCDGTGIYKRFLYPFGTCGYENVPCYNCDNGWYKKPCWNILERVKFGEYIFHQPLRRTFEKPDITPHINGYIEHEKHKYGWIAKSILFLLFEKGYLNRYYKNVYGWRSYWYYPKNWLFTICHFIKYGFKSYPIRNYKMNIVNKWQQLKSKFKKQDKYVSVQMSDDDLPF